MIPLYFLSSPRFAAGGFALSIKLKLAGKRGFVVVMRAVAARRGRARALDRVLMGQQPAMPERTGGERHANVRGDSGGYSGGFCNDFGDFAVFCSLYRPSQPKGRTAKNADIPRGLSGRSERI
jgi:hypothetical protein